MKIDREGWVVVADGRKALFAQNVGTPLDPKLEIRKVLEAEPNPPTHAQGTDRPGRAHDSTSPGRSAVGQTDWHARAEIEFVKSVARSLESFCEREGVRSLVLVAAPRALADLRDALAPAVRQRVSNEVDKDLTNHPLPQVEKVLAGL